jgi:adenylate cyclase
VNVPIPAPPVAPGRIGLKSEFTDPFELQEAVTSGIAASLHLQLVRAKHRRTIAERTTDPDAYWMRLRAMAYKITPENTLFARCHLERSLARDPNSAEGWSELANVLMIDVLRNWNNATEEQVARAEEAVQKAYAAIDRSVALVHVAEARIRRAKGDHQGALDACDKALQLDPNLTTALVQKAFELIYLGRAQEAALATSAITLSPHDPDPGNFYWVSGIANYIVKDYNKAIPLLQKSVQERPTTWYSRAALISAYALTGRLEQHEAQESLHEYREKFGHWPRDPKIKDWTGEKRFRNAHPEFTASLQEFLRGLQMAKETAGFP